GAPGVISPLQVERVPRLIQAALQSRGAACPRADEPPERAVAAHLAGALAEAAGLPREAARRAADSLLDPACYPVDYPAGVLHLWPCPEEAFVAGLFLLLLRRAGDPPRQRRYVRHLRRGIPRRAVVEHIARSREAAEAGLPLAWLPAFLRRPPAEPPRRFRLLDRLRVLATRLAWAARRRRAG